jgi:large subunit ribosomal protein L10
MNRQEKQVLIEQLKSEFLQSKASFLVGVEGMTVSQIQVLRKGLRSEGATLKLAKNSLMKIAARDIPGVQDLAPYFKEQVALVFAPNDSVAVARIVCDISRDNERLVIVAGCLESRVIDKGMVTFLASLPPRPLLLAQVCGVLKAPMATHVGLLHQLIARLLWVLKQASAEQQQ